jgi:hypothetical protein
MSQSPERIIHVVIFHLLSSSLRVINQTLRRGEKNIRLQEISSEFNLSPPARKWRFASLPEDKIINLFQKL